MASKKKPNPNPPPLVAAEVDVQRFESDWDESQPNAWVSSKLGAVRIDQMFRYLDHKNRIYAKRSETEFEDITANLSVESFSQLMKVEVRK